MFRNYLVVAWRNLWRHKVYSFINIFGLALSLACCLLIYTFVWSEWTYDAFHEKADRIFLVYIQNDAPGGPSVAAGLPSLYDQILQKAYTSIANTVRIQAVPLTAVVSVDGRSFRRENAFFVDSTLFAVFSFPLSKGASISALGSPNSAVVTEKLAHKYWGEEEALGKPLSISTDAGTQTFTVTGIARDLPENSTIQFDLLLPFSAAEFLVDPTTSSWTNFYIELSDGTGPALLEQQFQELIKQYLPKLQGSLTLRLLSLRDLHFTATMMLHRSPQGTPAYSYILAGIGLLVLAISCINFISLAIGCASTRAKEIGVRKVAGAHRSQLMVQFWGEFLLLSLLALGLGLALAEVLLPTFNELVQRHLSLDYTAWSTLGGITGLTLLTGLLAGVYPAVILSDFQPATVLKSTVRMGRKGWFGRGLVVFQFAFSTALVIAVLSMARQMDFLKAKDLGFDGEQVMIISLPYSELAKRTANAHLERYKNELAPHGGYIIRSTIVSPAPGANLFPYLWQVEGKQVPVYFFRGDHDFVRTLGLRLISGRDFDSSLAADEGVIINQTFARLLGGGDPIGRDLRGFMRTERKVIGVVEDFHYGDMHQMIEPVAIYLGKPHSRDLQDQLLNFMVRLNPTDIPKGLAILRSAWEKILPDTDFNYSFLDEQFDRMYREDERWQQIVFWASVFTVLIACLGLLGLALLSVSRRTKEIGIRKVLGASVPSIVALLSKEFTCLVLAANLIAWPVAYFAMHRWLENFAYRIELGPGVFVLGGLLALLIAWLTVSCQAIRAARANPVEALRYE
jgi:putative ABC transport system permease protein